MLESESQKNKDSAWSLLALSPVFCLLQFHAVSLYCKWTQKGWENWVDARTLLSYLTVHGAVSSVPLRPSVRPCRAGRWHAAASPISTVCRLVSGAPLAGIVGAMFIRGGRAAAWPGGAGRLGVGCTAGGPAVERGERCRQSLNVRTSSEQIGQQAWSVCVASLAAG